MTWFKVDDSFYDHPKAFDATDAAIALWIRAGTWSARNLTDGFVPTGMLARLSTSGTAAAAELVTRGLWRRVRGGHRFHDWADYQPTKEEALANKNKMSVAGAVGNHRRWHVVPGKFDPDCRYCTGDEPATKGDRNANEGRSKGPRRSSGSGGSGGVRNAPTSTGGLGTGSGTANEVPTNGQRNANEGRSNASGLVVERPDEPPVDNSRSGAESGTDQHGNASGTRSGGDRVGDRVSESPPNPPDPSRPDLSRGGGSYVTNDRAHASSPPPTRCDDHLTDPNPPPCRACGDRRKARETYDRDQAGAAGRAQSERARQQAIASRAAIDACPLCDPTGYRDSRLCTHDPDQDTRVRRGAATAAAAIRRPTSQEKP